MRGEIKEYVFLVILSVISDVDRRRRANFSETISAHEAFDILRGVAGDIAIDVGDDIASDVDADFVNVVDSIEVISTHEMMNRESFELEVDDETVETFATAKIVEKAC